MKASKGFNIFQKTKLRKPKESSFNLSHDLKTSFNMGELIPTTVMDILPGDKVKISVENMLRFAPLISPVMHKVKVQTHYFFVPNRLLWKDWDKWITGDSDVEHPFITIPGNDFISPGSLGDHLGITNGSPEQVTISPLPMAAYDKIFDEYFRDQNLVEERFVPLFPGDNNQPYRLKYERNPARRAWMHDYFTSCLPFAQKGEEAMIPLGDFNDVRLDYNHLDGDTFLNRGLDGLPAANADFDFIGTDANGSITNDVNNNPLHIDVTQNTFAKTSELNADAASVTNLRRAFRLQEWLERNARGGTRYVENILSHFGVRSRDSRLQRPEYIGGSRQNMTISEVLSTAQTEVTGGEIPIGQMGGHGISVGGGNSFEYSATEHGFIIGIISVMPETAYQQGIQKMHLRFDPFDYAWPTFAHIGEQPVTGLELYTGPGATPEYLDGTFGYIPRYSEYRYLPSRVSGDMRDDLAFWHLGRIFNDPPQLNEEFIECNPSRRIFAVTDPTEDTIYAHIFNNITAVRKLPKYGTPMF